ncbi:MAG: biotin--[acetyl-CoA-carboxylase] ligase [Magnetococcales bacterium]|nr:biotin--[acetyl-CoA-carboxylase] ligase [Magnetococcales bacterium]
MEGILAEWREEAEQLPAMFPPSRAMVYEQLPSTSDEALRLAREGAAEGTLILTDRQTAGRGRMGRTWYAPPGVNLSFSFILRPPLAPRQAHWLTLLAGVALHRAASGWVPGGGLALKWPNDLLLGERKCAGILTEMIARGVRLDAVVVGVGINVLQLPQGFPPELGGRAAALGEGVADPPQRMKLLAGFLHEFSGTYLRLLAEGFDPLRREWLTRALPMGRRVSVETPSGVWSGTADGLDEAGFLRLRREDGGIVRVTAGEVNFFPSEESAASAKDS